MRGTWRGVSHESLPGPLPLLRLAIPRGRRGSGCTLRPYGTRRRLHGRNPGELPPVLDAESGWRHHRPTCPPGVDARQLAIFLRAVEEAFGVKPIVYTEYSFVVSCLAGNAAVFRGHLQWLASWGAKPHPLPGTDQTWTFWQYTDQAQTRAFRMTSTVVSTAAR
ncbi:GH25 family lysozyme [Streptomyces sp. I6]|uniref:GH25 family lysozyme n=1 Tax=Streptomyces sp. I6 TaxID=2483113 RepID=UPI00288053DC|nr:GH25 family lysozyme [Streptomyces sp. I6]